MYNSYRLINWEQVEKHSHRFEHKKHDFSHSDNRVTHARLKLVDMFSCVIPTKFKFHSDCLKSLVNRYYCLKKSAKITFNYKKILCEENILRLANTFFVKSGIETFSTKFIDEVRARKKVLRKKDITIIRQVDG